MTTSDGEPNPPSSRPGLLSVNRLVSLGIAVALVGTQMTWIAFLGWVLLYSAISREIEVSPESGANQLGGLQRSADPAATARNPEHEPTTSVAQSPSTTPTGSVETAVPSDTGPPDMRESPEAKPTNGVKETTTVPTGIISAALPLQTPHAAKRHKASIPRRYAELRHRIRRTASVYYWQSRGSYNSSFDRGYSYGGPAPHSDTGG
jgi:hypothetical protein